jgi:hypothetical protein
MLLPYGLSYRLIDLSTNERIFEETLSNHELERIILRISQKLVEARVWSPEAEIAVECTSFTGDDSIQDLQLESMSALLTLAADHYQPLTLRDARQAMQANMQTILNDDRKIKRLRETMDKLDLPVLKIGDILMTGKFKNRRAVITGFDTDDHGQPVAQTDKGDVKIFKPRISKLCPKDSSCAAITEDTMYKFQGLGNTPDPYRQSNVIRKHGFDRTNQEETPSGWTQSFRHPDGHTIETSHSKNGRDHIFSFHAASGTTHQGYKVADLNKHIRKYTKPGRTRSSAEYNPEKYAREKKGEL